MLKIKNNVGGSGGKDIIAFQVYQYPNAGAIYYSQSGMTWDKFINSEYNIDSAFYVMGGQIWYQNPNITNGGTINVSLNSIIDSKGSYQIISGGGSG